MTYQNDSRPAWASFVDLANDVKPFMQWPTSSSPQDQLLQNTVDAACWWAQDLMGKPIAPVECFRRFSGYSGFGGSMIDLPYYPVLTPGQGYSLTVVEFWGASGPHVLVEQTPEAQGGSDMYTLAPLTGIITRSYLGLLARPTFPGLRNIEVTWWAGRSPVPPQYRLAILRLVKHWWNHDMQGQLGGFQRVDAGGVPHEYFPLIPDDIMQIFAPGMQVGLA